jgi:hypothetical protein
VNAIISVLSYIGWHCLAATVCLFAYFGYFHYRHRSDPPYAGMLAAAVLCLGLPAVLAGGALYASARADFSNAILLVSAALGVAAIGLAVFFAIREYLRARRRRREPLYYGPPMRCGTYLFRNVDPDSIKDI